MIVKPIFLPRSLKTKVTLLTLFIFMISVWSLEFYSSRILREGIERMLGEEQFSTASLVAADLERELKERMTSLEIVASRITPAILGDTAVMQAFLEDHPALESMFNSGLWVTRLDGIGIADVPISTGRIGVNYSERAFMIGALQGKSTIGKPVMGKKLKAPAFAISTPIRDGAGQVIGVLMGAIDLSKLNFLSKITDSRYGKTGGYLLVARQYRLIVTATDKSRIMETLPEPGVIPLVDRFIEGYEGSGISVNPRGVEVLASAKGIPVAGWYVVALMPTAEAFAPINDMHRHLLLAAILMTLLAASLIWWALKQLLAPMVGAAMALGQMSQAGNPTPLPITSHDEISDLIGGFNRLLEILGQREAALQKSEAALRLTRISVEAASDALFWMTPEARIVDVNEAACRSLGYSREELLQLAVSEVDVNYDAEKWSQHFPELRQQGTLRFESEHRTKDGTAFPVEIVANYVRNGDQEFNCAFVRNITERKQLAAKQDLLESRLQQSEKMESIGTLAGGIAHDFNNILSAIFGFAELAMVDGGEEQRNQDLKQVLLAAERARQLVRQILAFSRRTEQEVHPLQVSLVIKEALKLLRASIPSTIEIKQDIASNSTVLADPTQIHQIIMNLCTNAYHAMRETGGILAISATDMEIGGGDEGYGALAPGRYMKIEISDTGSGIPPEIKEKIFEPYFTTKKTGEGTGLGLAVVHGIIKSYNGNITVYSEPGAGTTFRVYLPLVDEKAVALAVKEVVCDFTGKGERIMFVDDEAQIREFSDQLFTLHGYQVTCFSNGVQALDEFKRQPDRFDLVITDMTMPYMTGTDLAQQILGIRPELPIILCTGQSELVNGEKALAMGICDYLSKPVAQHDYLAAISKALRKTTHNI